MERKRRIFFVYQSTVLLDGMSFARDSAIELLLLVEADSGRGVDDSSRVVVSKTLMVARGVILYSLAIRCSIK